MRSAECGGTDERSGASSRGAVCGGTDEAEWGVVAGAECDGTDERSGASCGVRGCGEVTTRVTTCAECHHAGPRWRRRRLVSERTYRRRAPIRARWQQIGALHSRPLGARLGAVNPPHSAPNNDAPLRLVSPAALRTPQRRPTPLVSPAAHRTPDAAAHLATKKGPAPRSRALQPPKLSALRTLRAPPAVPGIERVPSS